MRVLLIWISLVCVAIPVQAVGKPRPKIAVAPLAGDTNDKVALAIVDALAGDDFVVVGPDEVSREMKKLGMSDELDAKDARKLAIKLEVDALVDGKLTKAGKKRSLRLEVHRRGKPDAGFTIEFKSSSSDGFRRVVHDEIAKKLDGATDDTPDEDDQVKKQPTDDDDRKRTLAAADDATRRARKPAGDDDDDRKRKRTDDEPTAERRKRVPDASFDDEPAVRKRKSRKQAGGEQVAPQALARVGAGALVAQRRLTYDTRTGLTPKQAPPRVITTAGAGRVDGELYPIALANPTSGLAGLGLGAAYDKTFGLSIKIPNRTLQAPIDQSHLAIGARYRFGVGGASAVVLGFDYVRRHYIADRSSLMAVVLDAPDVDYTAVAPGIAARVPVARAVTMFGCLDAMLIFNTGQIQKTSSYGPATVYGLDLAGGADIALAKQLGLRIALEYSQINFSFGTKGMMAMLRDNDATTQDVSGAVDRSIARSASRRRSA